jgi:hypothetical protein
MTQEEKMLLIKDLSARLPYAVTVEHTSGFRGTLHDIAIHHMYDDNDNIYDAICYTDFFGDEDSIYIEYFKPYLFPLSSMTEEQKRELLELTGYEARCEESCGFDSWGFYVNIVGEYTYEDNQESVILYPDAIGIDWCNKNHFDYRGLIEKGLAIDATGLNIY